MARTQRAAFLVLFLAGCGLGMDLGPPEGPQPAVDAAAMDATPPPDAAPALDAPPPTDAGTCAPLPEECNGLDDNCNGLIDEIFDFENDPTRCGGCTTACAASSHGTPTCVAGACGLLCEPGWEDCDGSFGCEADLGSFENCGTCGNRCPPGAPRCVHLGGTYDCAADCPSAAPTFCGGSCVDVETDPRHCGECGSGCGLPNATPTCVGGSCQIGACAPSWGDCDGSVTNGCETRLDTNSDCGTCGNACGPMTSCGLGGVCVSATARCESWATSWICTGIPMDPGSCRGTCGAHVITCTASGGCSCDGMTCPPLLGADCGRCQRAVDRGCCGF